MDPLFFSIPDFSSRLKPRVTSKAIDCPITINVQVNRNQMAVGLRVVTLKAYGTEGRRNLTTEYIKGCATCQMSKINMNPSKPALFPITPEPNALPFQTISLDFIVKLPELEGFDTILTITDHDCSKAAMFMPCNETVNAAGVAKLYATYVFPHYGLPRKIISDRDPRFASNFSREMCNL